MNNERKPTITFTGHKYKDHILNYTKHHQRS